MCSASGALGSLQRECLSILPPDILSASQSETFFMVGNVSTKWGLIG